MNSCWYYDTLWKMAPSWGILFWERGKLTHNYQNTRPIIVVNLKAHIVLSLFSLQSWWPIEAKFSQNVSQIILFYVGIHQVRMLFFDNYRRCPLPLNLSVVSALFKLHLTHVCERTTGYGLQICLILPVILLKSSFLVFKLNLDIHCWTFKSYWALISQGSEPLSCFYSVNNRF